MDVKTLGVFAAMTLAVACFADNTARAYDIPSRKIEITPYLNIIFPHDLLGDSRGENIVKNNPGPGLGVKIHNQVYKSFGFLIDFSFTDLDVTNSSLSTAIIFTGGGYYTRSTGIGDFTLNFGYGVLSIAGYAQALFLPGIEYNRKISERAVISTGVDWVLPNDWIYEESIETTYGNYSLFLGCGVIF